MIVGKLASLVLFFWAYCVDDGCHGGLLSIIVTIIQLTVMWSREYSLQMIRCGAYSCCCISLYCNIMTRNVQPIQWKKPTNFVNLTKTSIFLSKVIFCTYPLKVIFSLESCFNWIKEKASGLIWIQNIRTLKVLAYSSYENLWSAQIERSQSC